MTTPQEELDRYKEVTDKATPGTWFVDKTGLCDPFVATCAATETYVASDYAMPIEGCDHLPGDHVHTDDEFIAMSHEMAPKLLQEIQELREENADLRLGRESHHICEQVADARIAELEAQNERLSLALHKAQKHPDFDYSVTFIGQEEHHTSREGWELNPALPSLKLPLGRGEQFWMKRKADES